jgi:hypothetical protein
MNINIWHLCVCVHIKQIVENNIIEICTEKDINCDKLLNNTLKMTLQDMHLK